MVTKEFKEGFVKACLARNCDRDQTEDLFKVAFLAQAFDNEEFKKGFQPELVPGFNPESLSMFAKSELVDRAARRFLG